MSDFQIENGILLKYCGDDTDIAIPDGVISVGDRAFAERSDIIRVKIPDSVTEIGNYSFYRCASLCGITVPDSVKRIGDGAFYGCSSFTEFTVPDSVTVLGERLLEGCTKIRNYALPKALSNHPITVGNFQIRNGILKRYIGKAEYEVVPDTVTAIGDGAFSDCITLREIVLPEGVTSIGCKAFSRMPRIEKINLKLAHMEVAEDRDSTHAWVAAIRGFLSRYYLGTVSEEENAEWKKYIGKRKPKAFKYLTNDPCFYRYIVENTSVNQKRLSELLEKTENIECRAVLLDYAARRTLKSKNGTDGIIDKLFSLDG